MSSRWATQIHHFIAIPAHPWVLWGLLQRKILFRVHYPSIHLSIPLAIPTWVTRSTLIHPPIIPNVLTLNNTTLVSSYCNVYYNKAKLASMFPNNKGKGARTHLVIFYTCSRLPTMSVFYVLIKFFIDPNPTDKSFNIELNICCLIWYLHTGNKCGIYEPM